MLVSKQLTDTLLDNTRIIRKESLEIRYECRHTMCIARILRYVAHKERTSLAQSLQAPSPRPNNPPKGTA